MKIDYSLDHANCRAVFKAFPDQFLKTLEAVGEKKVSGDFSNVVLCGMGGSAMPYDLLKAYFSAKKINLPLEVSRTYSLPFNVNGQTLVIISSYSGNTEESLSCFDEAETKGFKIVAFARGGQIEKRCLEKRHVFIEYPAEPAEFQPRAALGYSFSAILYFLMNSNLIPENKKEITDLVDFLKNQDFEALGQEIAAEIGNLIPVVYTAEEYAATVGRIIKIKFNENSKYPSFYNALPELNHNEMVGFTQKAANFYFLFFKDSASHPRILKRFTITRQILADKGAKVREIEMTGETFLQKMFAALFLGDYLTYYKALLSGLDPTPVEMVESFKKMLIS